MKLTIGFTHTDREIDYVPAMDGWVPGMAQQVVEIEVGEDDAPDDITWTEAVFTATNAPEEVTYRSEYARRVYEALTEQAMDRVPRSLSVGDTVTVDDDRKYAVDRIGWVLI